MKLYQNANPVSFCRVGFPSSLIFPNPAIEKMPAAPNFCDSPVGRSVEEGQVSATSVFAGTSAPNSCELLSGCQIWRSSDLHTDRLLLGLVHPNPRHRFL